MPKRKTPYRSKVKIGVDAAGKPINKWIQGRTRAELAEARAEVIARYITGEALGDDRLFGDYAAEWYRIRKEPFISASTRGSYRTALNKHLFPVYGDRMLRSIGAMELQEFLNGYAGKSKSQITNILATLRGVFGSAMADRLIFTDPTDHLIRPAARPTAVKPALTAEQRATLEEVCRTHPQGHYLALMYYLGCRPGEAARADVAGRRLGRRSHPHRARHRLQGSRQPRRAEERRKSPSCAHARAPARPPAPPA